jgi:DNA invertase Pin-like site-specific DNA recombinase
MIINVNGGCRVALYLRVSTEDQATDNQARDLRAFAATQGWRVVREFCDEAVSGSKPASQRPQFAAMFEAASRREFDVLLFWSLDRLSREGVLPTLRHLEQLTGYGIAWRSFTEQYLDSTGVFKDAVISIMATIARQENIRRSERTKAGLQRVRAQGVKLGRPAAKFDHRKAQRMRAEGRSLREIGERLRVSASLVHARLKNGEPVNSK